MGFFAVHTQAAEDPAAEAIKTPCDADIYLAAVEEHLRQRLKANGGAAAQLTAQARQLLLAAVAADDPTKSCFLGAVASAAAAKARDAEQQSATRGTTFKLALDQINKLRREMAAIATLSQLKLTVKNSGHRQKGSNQATHSIIQADAATPLGCGAQHKLAEGKISTHEPNPTNLLSLRIANTQKKAEGTADNALELTMADSCNHGGAAYTNWASASASCDQGNIRSLAPSIVQSGIQATQRTEPIKSLQLYETTGNVGNCNPKHDKATEEANPEEYAAKAICQALRTTPAEGKQLTLNGEALAAETLVVDAVQREEKAFRQRPPNPN
ncbi:uncharacterized protein TEOVI_000180800 [Trypanosoma equiperdum]|uniref:Uncharacterized protein n=1 Tax=Trypanosoma equiperdum TaxID=5694 RepID=A0A1G4IDJ7_TRYEQ|nr:hypothetical protein, conserved [Trypanosoma equiperdum]